MEGIQKTLLLEKERLLESQIRSIQFFRIYVLAPTTLRWLWCSENPFFLAVYL